MRLALYLLRRHIIVYSIFWAVMASTLVVFVVSFDVFGPWILQTGRASALSLALDVAPGWLMFANGAVAAVTHLPLAVAHGVTRREFCVGAAVFAVASAVLFQIFKVVGLLLEAMAYDARGLMERIAEPYPWPTITGSLADISRMLAFMVGGWLVGLAFYRLRVWWALLLLPIATIPVSSDAFEPPVFVFLGILAVATVAAYLAARGLAVKPRRP